MWRPPLALRRPRRADMVAWVLHGLQPERAQETRKPTSSRGLGQETDSLPASAQLDSIFFIM
jgi:hypothetical protein